MQEDRVKMANEIFATNVQDFYADPEIETIRKLTFKIRPSDNKIFVK